MINISENPGVSKEQRAILDGEDNLHIVWTDNTIRSSNDIMHRWRTPDGIWSEAAPTTSGFERVTGGSTLARKPDGQICLFMWAVGPGDVGHKNYMQCWQVTDWSEARISSENGKSVSPAFTPSGNLKTIYVTGVATLNFAGQPISDRFANAYVHRFAIGDDGTYHAVWTRQGDPFFTLIHIFSQDEGATWSEQEVLSTEDTAPSGAKSMVTDRAGIVHLVWAGKGQVLYRQWTPEEDWGDMVDLTAKSPETNPATRGNGSTTIGLTLDAEGLPHVVWQGHAMWYTYQLADGSWSVPFNILNEGGEGPGPEIVVDGQGVRHFVWNGRDISDIFYANIVMNE